MQVESTCILMDVPGHILHTYHCKLVPLAAARATWGSHLVG